jgi:hypothetical protein
MRLMTNFLWFTVGVLFVLLFAVNAYPHDSGFDVFDCRQNCTAGDNKSTENGA